MNALASHHVNPGVELSWGQACQHVIYLVAVTVHIQRRGGGGGWLHMASVRNLVRFELMLPGFVVFISVSLWEPPACSSHVQCAQLEANNRGN